MVKIKLIILVEDIHGNAIESIAPASHTEFEEAIEKLNIKHDLIDQEITTLFTAKINLTQPFPTEPNELHQSPEYSGENYEPEELNTEEPAKCDEILPKAEELTDDID